jgi:uncharacterized membrane protein
MTKADSLTKIIAENAIVAAIYFVLTFAFSSLSYGQIQFRIAEFLVLLCFWRPDFVFGITLGCFLANMYSLIWPWDMIIGTLATLISCLLVSYASPRLGMAMVFPIAINAFVVGWELWFFLEMDFWLSVCYVGLGEAFVILCSYVLWLLLSKNKGFMGALSPKRHVGVRW